MLIEEPSLRARAIALASRLLRSEALEHRRAAAAGLLMATQAGLMDASSELVDGPLNPGRPTVPVLTFDLYEDLDHIEIVAPPTAGPDHTLSSTPHSQRSDADGDGDGTPNDGTPDRF